MIRPLFFVLIFLLAPFVKAQANIGVQNCAISSVTSNQKKAEGIFGRPVSKLRRHQDVFTQSDIDEANTVNEREEAFIILHIWSSVLWAALEKTQNNQKYFSTDVSAVLPAKYLLYQQLKIPFS